MTLQFYLGAGYLKKNVPNNRDENYMPEKFIPWLY